MPRLPSALCLALAFVLGGGGGGAPASWAAARPSAAGSSGAPGAASAAAKRAERQAPRAAGAGSRAAGSRAASSQKAGTKETGRGAKASAASRGAPARAGQEGRAGAVLGAVRSRGSDAPEAALAEARAALRALRADASRRRYRHHWLNVVRRLDRLSQRAPRHPVAAEALALAAETCGELARLSGLAEDAAEARRRHRALVEARPRHRLASEGARSGAGSLEERRTGERAAASVGRGAAALDGVPRAASPAQGRTDEAHEAAESLGRIARATQRLLAERSAGRAEEPGAAGAAHPARGEAPSASAALAPTEVARGRRLSPQRPRDDAAAALERATGPHGPDDVEEHETSPLAALSERLRDVRIGERAPAAVSEDARLRLRAHAREERDAELTLAQQLGLKVRRVVVDPGHGGHDTGAIGPAGTYEKDVALAISLKLAERLEALGFEVVLTRSDDRFVKLEERSAMANRVRGDLFVSIHCNAAANKRLRGVETYTLNLASSRYAKRLAARENATSDRGIGDLQYLLADLATKANTGESTRLAERVQRDLVASLSARYAGVVDLGHKEALFFVLLGARMPAILLETSFLSNAEEEKRLVSEDYQSAVAESVARSLADYLEARERLASAE